MEKSTCPKCKAQGKNSLSCKSCGLVYAEYETDKQEAIGEVYSLIRAGKLKDAKNLAESLAGDFPDSTGEFVLLLSNINRDINIEEKLSQARLLFEKEQFNDVVLLLRNIKAFDPILEERIISLRKKALRHKDHGDFFKQAVEQFNSGKFAHAKTLFMALHDAKEQDEAKKYLKKIDKKKEELFQQAIQCLKDNLFDAAEKCFDTLLIQFPEMEQQADKYIVIITAKRKIKKNLLKAADKAKQEGRFLEARIIYTFLGWQYPEFQSRMGSYFDENILREEISLADLADQEKIDFPTLGLKIDQFGLLHPTNGQSSCVADLSAQTRLLPFSGSPDPSPDIPSKPVNLLDQQVADFTC